MAIVAPGTEREVDAEQQPDRQVQNGVMSTPASGTGSSRAATGAVSLLLRETPGRSSAGRARGRDHSRGIAARSVLMCCVAPTRARTGRREEQQRARVSHDRGAAAAA